MKKPSSVFMLAAVCVFLGSTAVATLQAQTNTTHNTQLAAEFGNGHLTGPESIAISSVTSNIFVADSSGLVSFDRFGNYLATYGTNGEGQLSGPIGCAVDAQGNVYVGDYTGHQCVEFTGGGAYVQTFNGFSNELTLGLVTGVAVDASNNVYVADDSYSRIIVFAPSGQVMSLFSTIIGDRGGAGNVGIAFDPEGDLWVADYYYARFARYSPTGSLLASYGSYSNVIGPGFFEEPYGITVDAHNNIYVTDTELSTVQEFNSSGEFEGFFGSKGNGAGQFDGPNGVAVDRAGHVLVSDAVNKRIVVFTPAAAGVITIAITSPTNGDSFLTTSNLTIKATVHSAGAITAVEYYLDTNTLVASSTVAPYTVQIPAGTIPPGGHQLSAIAVGAGGASGSSAPIHITANAPGTDLIDFDALNATEGSVAGTAMANYLGNYGVTLSNVTIGTALEAINETNLNGNIQVLAASYPNFFTQAGLNQPVSFTLNFATPLQSFGFTRCGLSLAAGAAANPGAVTHPQWTATIFDTNGAELGQIGEALISSSNSIPARSFELTGNGIASVRFDSDSQNRAAFSAVLLDNLFLDANPVASLLSVSLSVSNPPTNDIIAPATITLNANVTDTLGTNYYVSYFAGPNYLGSVSNSPYQFIWTNVLPDDYSLHARVVDISGLTINSKVAPITVQPEPHSTVVNFDTLNTSRAPVTGAAVSNYLAGFGVTVASVSPGTELTVERPPQIAGGAAAVAPSPPNIFTQTGSNGLVRFTLNFTPFLSQFGFTRPELLANPFVSHPAWQVTAYDGAGNIIGQAGEGEIDSLTNVGAQEFALGRLSGPGIAQVEFDSRGSGLTTFNAMLIDNLVLTTNPAAFPPAVAITRPIPNRVLAAPPSVTVTADAADETGVAQVSFYENITGVVVANFPPVLLGKATASPYTIFWKNPPIGNYALTAVASNLSGLTWTSSVVNISIRESADQFGILSEPGNQTVALGGSATFALVPTGTNVFTYQWSHNNRRIARATSSTYTLNPPIQDSDAGSYTVAVTANGETLISDPAILTVVDPPTFVTQPAGQTVSPGTDLTLSATVSGGGPYTWQWLLNGARIPGATNSSFLIPAAQPIQSGNYSVVVANLAASAVSSIAPVIVQTPVIIPETNDTFATRARIHPLLETISASNRFAIYEPGEPLPDGLPGGNSIWFTWESPFTGTISLTTEGSDFDTVMAVYTGTNLQKLKLIAADDDSGGYFTSLVTFNVTKDFNYQIAVDGYEGASGRVVLGLPTGTGYRILNPTTGDAVPVIVKGPASEVVALNAKVVLSVTAQSATKMTYQWYFQGTPISGATNSSFTIAHIQPPAVGLYYVLVANAVGSAQSEPARIQIAENQGRTSVVAENKFTNSTGGITPASLAYDLHPTDAGGDTRGFSVSQTFSTIGESKEPGEPDTCGQAGGAPEWFAYTAPATGILQVNTDGSTFNTILGVYIGTGATFSNLTEAGCGYSTNYTEQGQPSVVIPDVAEGTQFFIVVDGYQGVSGMAQLHIGLGQPPSISALPSSQLVTTGSNATFNVTAIGSTNLSYQWQLNGVSLTNATGPSFTVTNAQDEGVGNYTVIVSNIVGVVTSSPPATLTLQFAPVVIGGPTNESVQLGHTAEFGVTTIGVNVATNKFHYQWYFNGIPLLHATNVSLSFPAEWTNQGGYNVIITNSYGSATSAVATLTVTEAGVSPGITREPTNQSVPVGGTAHFAITASGAAPLFYQWLFNATNLQGNTNTSLTLSNISVNNAGAYSAFASNMYGAVTSATATLSIPNVAALFATNGGGIRLSNGSIVLGLTGLTGQGTIVVDASTNLIQWTPIFTNPSAFGEIQFADPAASNFPARYYRATTPIGP